MRNSKPKFTGAAQSLKYWADVLSQATDLPASSMKVPRSVLGLAATVPTNAQSLRSLAKRLVMIADGEPWEPLFGIRKRRGRAPTLAERAREYEILLAKGVNAAEAAARIGGNAATLKREGRRHRYVAIVNALASHDLTVEQVNAYSAFNRQRAARRQRGHEHHPRRSRGG